MGIGPLFDAGFTEGEKAARAEMSRILTAWGDYYFQRIGSATYLVHYHRIASAIENEEYPPKEAPDFIYAPSSDDDPMRRVGRLETWGRVVEWLKGQTEPLDPQALYREWYATLIYGDDPLEEEMPFPALDARAEAVATVLTQSDGQQRLDQLLEAARTAGRAEVQFAQNAAAVHESETVTLALEIRDDVTTNP